MTESRPHPRPFVHLHCHTHYSLLDGANRIDALVAKVKASGMNAVAITDHGNLYGALEFYNECRAHEINPIIGYEAYVAPKGRGDKSATRMKEASFHLTLLAMNRAGFQNLVRLSTAAFLEGFYYKPRIDKELLEAHSEGIMCLSGCAAGELSFLLLGGRMDEAEQLAAWYHRVFGDRFYLEIQNGGLEIQRQCAEGTIELAKRMGVPLVATNDAHYLEQSDADAHDVLLCVNTLALRNDTKRMRMEGDKFFVRTPDEMYDAFPEYPDAVAITQQIADRVDIDLDISKRHFPVFTPPAGKTDAQYLRELCEEGVPVRYTEVTSVHRERLDYELSVIEKMGYASYFLIVWDFVRFANEQQIPCQARGSACGSLVAYLLGLSNVCPIKFDLLFERFLDPNRAEPPDIDIDFCRDGRQAVIDYTKEKYGKESVAQIGTFGTLKAKAAIRDVSRVLSIPLPRVNEIAQMVPDELNIKLVDALAKSPDLKLAYEGDPQVREMIDIAIRLEDLARSAGTHAAGVVVGDRPLVDYIPLQRITGKEDVITQWDGPRVEQAGLLKMDFLGLTNLTILDKTVKNVQKHRGLDIDPEKLPLDDPATFALLQRGETKGIFQLESGGMRDLLTKMKPDRFNDIIATSALYRPGPLEGGMVMTYVNVKHGIEPVPKVHPIVDEILAETYGVMVYQEQVMRILNRVGGIELSSAYGCIKAISKKKLKAIAKYREEYIAGAQKNGLSGTKSVELFDMIEKFAGYGFNKSHSTAYAAIAYQTAYFKAHYPVEFMAALLSCLMDKSDRIAEHVDDARRMHIKILPPDINSSDVEFSVLGNELSFGLAAIKGLGGGVVAAIVAERKERGPFASIFDLAERVDSKVLGKGALELLIKAGALDSLGPTPAQHMLLAERAVQSASSMHRDRAKGQKKLFGGAEPQEQKTAPTAVVLPDVPDWTHAQKLAFEKEAFGFYLTSHPLAENAEQITRYATHSLKDIASVDEKAEILLGGMVSSIKKATTKKPSRNGHSRYVNFDFETPEGMIRCIMWPEDYARHGESVKAEQIGYVKGRVDRRGREPNIIASQLITLEEAGRLYTTQVAVKFQRGLHSEHDMQRVRQILQANPGPVEVVIFVESADEADPTVRRRFRLKQPLSVSCTSNLRSELTGVVGEEHVRFNGSPPKKNGRNLESRRPAVVLG
jgi:DNA polymerase-3 subunit alpha